MIILVLVLVIIIAKLWPKPQRVKFEINQAKKLNCGCVLIHEQISGAMALKPCAAHQLMADAL